MKKNDLILAVVVFLFGVILLLGQRLLGNSSDGVVTVYRDREKVATYPMDASVVENFEAAGGGYNLLVIEDGCAYISEADCPDGLCMKQGRIDKDGQALICLPHKLTVRIEGGEKAELDGVIR